METPGFSFSPVVYSYPRGHVIGAHSHPFPQLLFAASGVLSVEVPKGTWVVPPQRAVWLPADCSHAVRMQTDVRITSMYIKRTSGLEHLDCQILEISPLLRELLLASLEIDSDDDLSSRELIIFELLQEELRRASTCTPAIPLPQERRLAEICRMIMEDPSLGHSLAEVASRVGSSSRTIARLFSSELGMSYRKWCEQARVAYARAQLAQGRPAKVVASDLGYTASAFSVMMRRAAPKETDKQERAA